MTKTTTLNELDANRNQVEKEVENHVKITTKNTVVLDTSVLITDPEAIYAFGEDTTIMLPLTVIDELDKHKTRMDHVGKSARSAIRIIEKLRTKGSGTLTRLVNIPSGGTFYVELNGLLVDRVTNFGLSAENNDNRIIAAALGVQERNPKTKVRIISGDANFRIKAAALGLTAEEYLKVKGQDSTKRSGWHTITLNSSRIDEFYTAQMLSLDYITSNERELFKDVAENEFMVLKGGSQSALAQRKGKKILPLSTSTPKGLKAKSKEQSFALSLLTDPDIPIVTLTGVAGTGKTLLALAAGLEQVTRGEKIYDRLMILRPLYAVGKQEVGFLPGDLEEKLGPWMEAIVDAVIALNNKGRAGYKEAKAYIDLLSRDGTLSMEAVTFLRGRSLQRTFIIVDEAQNLEASVAKTILTRLGEGSKVVLVGDMEQKDNPFVGEHDNALAVLDGLLRGEKLFSHLTLTKGERSEVAELAARIL